MAYISQYKYYTNNGNTPTDANLGSYQYISLFDIVNNFILNYSGNHSLINNEERYKILFFAKRGIQEVSYDATNEIKVLQLNVAENLRFILPSDYVNWVKMSLFKDGLIRPLTENIQVNSAIQYDQELNGNIVFYGDEVVYVDPSRINEERLDGHLKSIYLNQNNPNDANNGQEGWYIDGVWYLRWNLGRSFGLNTETANTNPTFRVDKSAGVINFSSDMRNESCILEYVSDGMVNGDDSLIKVNKLFEDYLYAHILYEITNAKIGVQEYIVKRLQKNKMALLRNAKIRVSGIHPARLLMTMRGMDKIIK